MILLVIPFHKENAIQCERLLDWIFQLNNRKPYGHALLVAAHDAHEEKRERIKISSELAFESFEMIQISRIEGDKAAIISKTMLVASDYAAKNYKVPFLWLEPDCTPLELRWRQKLESAYKAQPRKVMGLLGERCAVYSPRKIETLSGNVFPSKLIQTLAITGDAECSRVDAEACLVHGDKRQILLDKIKARRNENSRTG